MFLCFYVFGNAPILRVACPITVTYRSTFHVQSRIFPLLIWGDLFISSFSKTRSPWTVCTFGVNPEQGKKLNQNSLFHSSTAKRTYISILVQLRMYFDFSHNYFLMGRMAISPFGYVCVTLCSRAAFNLEEP